MIDDDRLRALLLDVYDGLPRQGPGDDASSGRALELCTDLPVTPDVLDIGCGPGMQTVLLAQATGGTITAVDRHEQFLDELRARAVEAGVRDRTLVMRADMADLPFGMHSFDLIWCEGAAYFMGISNAFEGWKPFLRPQGYLVVSELVWLVPDVPTELREFFHGEYAGITDVPGNVARIEGCGYEVVGHFTISDEAWWTHYYDPLTARLAEARERYADDPGAIRFIESSEEELRLRRTYPDAYGYEFFVTRLLDPDALAKRATGRSRWLTRHPTSRSRPNRRALRSCLGRSSLRRSTEISRPDVELVGDGRILGSTGSRSGRGPRRLSRPKAGLSRAVGARLDHLSGLGWITHRGAAESPQGGLSRAKAPT